MDDNGNPYKPPDNLHEPIVNARCSPVTRRRVVGVLVATPFILALPMLYVGVQSAREAAARASCNLGPINMAFLNYHDTYGTFPPAIVRSADGTPLYSWRVLILPWIEHRGLYEAFRLDEPWDSPHNLSLLEHMPFAFEAPWLREVDVPPYHTLCRVLVGRGTAFEGEGGLSLSDFAEPDNTVLFVEAGEPVPWTMPEAIAYDPDEPVQLRGLFRSGFRACTVSFGRLFIEHDTDQESLHNLIRRDKRAVRPER